MMVGMRFKWLRFQFRDVVSIPAGCHKVRGMCWPADRRPVLLLKGYVPRSVKCCHDLCMTDWNRCGRKRSWPILMHYTNLLLQGLRKTTKIFSHRSRSPGWEFNLEPPDYKAGVLTTRPQWIASSF
jgi:hypothetical protein